MRETVITERFTRDSQRLITAMRTLKGALSTGTSIGVKVREVFFEKGYVS